MVGRLAQLPKGSKCVLVRALANSHVSLVGPGTDTYIDRLSLGLLHLLLSGPAGTTDEILLVYPRTHLFSQNQVTCVLVVWAELGSECIYHFVGGIACMKDHRGSFLFN